MTKPKQRLTEIVISSDIPLNTEEHQKLNSHAQAIADDNKNSTDDFLLKIIPIEHEEKKGVAAICPVKNDSEFINALRCVLQTFYTLNPKLTESIARYFFTEEAPKMTAPKQPKMH